MHGQENDFKKLDKLFYLKSKDTLWLDIKEGGCFQGNWNKFIISRRNDQFEIITLNNVTRILLEHDKAILLEDNTGDWIQKNIDIILKDDYSSILKKEEYFIFINKIIKAIKFYENCSADVVGDYSMIQLKLKKTTLEYSYNCRIHLNL